MAGCMTKPRCWQLQSSIRMRPTFTYSTRRCISRLDAKRQPADLPQAAHKVEHRAIFQNGAAAWIVCELDCRAQRCAAAWADRLGCCDRKGCASQATFQRP